ncbi:MAG: HDIG domain-containing protein [Selenomonadaceae bacterium]|nr:HDIG domain-containing protein [Selenomonadaceae bacterium]
MTTSRQRVRQFVRAVTARLSARERAWIDAALPAEARPLFYAMHPADQVHALRTAKTALALSKGQAVDRGFLTRCCLLHDVGRVRGDLDIFGKVWAVLAQHYLPDWSARMGHSGRVHFLQVYYEHPRLGAEKLRRAGLSREAAVIERHHEPPSPTDSAILWLLKEADSRN